MIVFLSTQGSVEFHQKLLSETVEKCNLGENKDASNVAIYKLHGDMPQKERMKIFNDFSQASSGVLLCTVRRLNIISCYIFKNMSLVSVLDFFMNKLSTKLYFRTLQREGLTCLM